MKVLINLFGALGLLAAGGIATAESAAAKTTTGTASFYWQDQKTASGEPFRKHDLTAAHRTLPFGTLVRVTRLSNGKQVTVRINDRGPFVKGRIIDLSLGAAEKIGLGKKAGVTKVKLEVIGNAQDEK